MCVCVCAFVSVWAHVCACVWRSKVDVWSLLDHFLTYLMRQDLSFKLRVPQHTLASRLALGIPGICPQSAEITGRPPLPWHCCDSGGLNSKSWVHCCMWFLFLHGFRLSKAGSHACTPATSWTDTPPPQLASEKAFLTLFAAVINLSTTSERGEGESTYSTTECLILNGHWKIQGTTT